MGRGRREEGRGRRSSVCFGESQRARKGGELSSAHTAQQSPGLDPFAGCLGPCMPSLARPWVPLWDTEMLRVAHPFPSSGEMRSVWRPQALQGTVSQWSDL